MSKKSPPPARDYALRYLLEFEPWGKPAGPRTPTPIPGVSVSETPYGYADELMVFSVLRGPDGAISSVALFDSVSGCGRPSRELLEAARDQIIHHLEKHT